jgi:hypothetical protein
MFSQFFEDNTTYKSLGIIGTAGRGADMIRLNTGVYTRMLEVAKIVVARHRFTKLVSGGAAWADHVAVDLFHRRVCEKLSLHLPAEWDSEAGCYRENTDAGKTSNYYHHLFTTKTNGFSTMADIQEAIAHGAHYDVSNGFFTRNNLVARESDVLLAFTFGNGHVLKDGGTKNTWDAFFKMKTYPFGYHYDLNLNKLWSVGTEHFRDVHEPFFKEIDLTSPNTSTNINPTSE